MTLAINVTYDSLMTALGNFLVAAFAAQVVQGQVNRVAMPQGNFIQMTPLLLSDLSTARTSYAPVDGTQAITNPTKWTCQLDFYGPAAANNVAIFKAVIRTEYACQQFAAAGFEFQPLYAGDARNTALINGEQQYENRYTLDFIAQFNPIVTVVQDFANTLTVVLKEVDTTFPP
jgi:hypothetical protein